MFLSSKIHHTDEGKESKRLLDTSHIYEGRVLGDKDSFVHGSISDGVFHGRIVTSKDSYYVEKARYYFPNHSYVEEGFHSIIYKDKHVDDPHKNIRTVHSNGCGLTEDVSRWMDHVQNSAEYEEEIEVVPLKKKTNENGKNGTEADNKNNIYKHVNNNRIYNDNASNDDEDVESESYHPHRKYSKEANSRTKRATARFQEKNTCSLYIQTDPLIWRHIRESIPDHQVKIVYMQIIIIACIIIFSL